MHFVASTLNIFALLRSLQIAQHITNNIFIFQPYLKTRQKHIKRLPRSINFLFRQINQNSLCETYKTQNSLQINIY